MKYHIDTIPVWDAYKAGGECPMCTLAMQNEQNYLELAMGDSVMEPDRRIVVNDKGFCQRHFQMMYDMGNRLGLALMTHTHLQETISKIKAAYEAETPKKRGLFEGLRGAQKEAKKEDKEDTFNTRCALCDSLHETMERYLYTLLHLYKTDAEFRAIFESSLGLCVPHHTALKKMAPKHLSGQDQKKFLTALHDLQMRNLERIEKDLSWFTLKFDYRNQDKPWGSSKDAVQRAINKLRGHCIEE